MGVPETEVSESKCKNIWRDNNWKFLKMGKRNRQPSPGSTDIPRQNKFKKERAESHSN